MHRVVHDNTMDFGQCRVRKGIFVKYCAILETHHACACRFSRAIGGIAAIAGRSQISGGDCDEGKGDLPAWELCVPGSLV